MRRGRRRTNLVHPASSFVGRGAELTQLSALFEEARLVTVLGPGGMGKTRLALRHAEAHLASYTTRGAGGAWFVDLSEARTVADALLAVAAVLALPLVGLSTDDAIAGAIGHELARRGRVLIVLDNVEPVAGAFAPFVERWVRTAPSARVLVTSRVALAVEAEHALALGPLARDDAMALFVGRARLVRSDADLDDRDATGEIVDAIDRMPLAIELAASRMRVLSTADLRARLDRPLALLRKGDADDRHGSVGRAVLDSVALLPPPARRFFALCSVLCNGFTLEDAEATLGDVALPRAQVLDTVDVLARTSLLRVESAPGDRARFALFDTIRDVAEELAADDPERPAVLAAHARHFATRARALGLPAERDLENLLRAHETAVARAKNGEAADDAVPIALGLEPLLSARGLSRLRARLFTDTLEALDASESADARARAQVHLGLGLALRELGETARARAQFERARASADTAGDGGLSAVALTRLGGVHDLMGDTIGARAEASRALSLLAETAAGEVRTSREAEAHLLAGHAHRREGALDAAARAIREAIARYRALADDEGLAAAIYELGVIEMFAGHGDEALALFGEGLLVARRAGLRVMEGALTTARGGILQERGELDDALAHHAEAARIFAELGSRYREASALFYVATAYLERHEPEEALAVLRQARERLVTVGAPRYEALMAAAAATASAWLGRDEDAAKELDRAERALAQVPHEPALAAVVTVHRWNVEVRAGRRDGDAAVAEAERLVGAHASDDSRFALRALTALVRGSRAEPSPELLVWPDGSAFRAPGASTIELPRRSPLRRILELFVTRRLDAPGDVVSIDEVITAGWPGERIGTEAALNRAYVALSSLRKRGLHDLLLRTGGGYALSRAVVVRRAPAD